MGFCKFLLCWINEGLLLLYLLYLLLGSDESKEVLVGDVTTYQLHNLQPGTTYDVKVLAQYNAGDSAPLIGEGTTRKKPERLPIPPFACLGQRGLTAAPFCLVYLNVTDLTTYNVGYDSFCVRWTPHRAATSYRLKINPFDSE